MENKVCQNCSQNFAIEPDDFSFYEKIGVPAPTFCPECRMIRRMIWRNVRSLYKRQCGICSKTLISMYKDDGAPVLCTECWNSDEWDPLSYGQEYDFSRPFFDQILELFKKAPRYFAYHTGTLVNSDYTNYSADNKNAYLSYSVIGCEDVMYSESIDKSKNCLDCDNVQKLDNCFHNMECEGNYSSHYMLQSQKCIDSYFLYDCVNCQNCCMSSNLRNKQYYFKNKKLTKEEYEETIRNLNLDQYSEVEKSKKYFYDMYKNQAIHKYAQILNSVDVSGENIRNSRNVKYSFDVVDSENIHYGSRVLMNCKDCYDVQGLAVGELIYDCVASSWGTYRDYFCYITLGCKECEYSFILKNSSHCFGCVGLTNMQYCIFNKQYTKEEYFPLVEKIKKHMMEMPYTDSKGRIYKYGEFFPFEFSPFAYNETVALDSFLGVDEAEALSKGYSWKTPEKKDYKITIKSSELADSINDVNDSILSEVVGCPNQGDSAFQCTTAYKITENESQFYRQKNIPLPRYCPNCRHYIRFQYHNPLRLWHRKCMNGCGNEFETSYSPERPEKVYCESCYQKEVL